MGAGILPVSVHNNNIYVLLSREYINSKNGGKWSDFGGSKEGKETYFQTAVREGWEESDGFLGNQQEIRNLIKNNFIKTITLGGYRTYLVYIPYDKTLPDRFRKKFLHVRKTHPEKIYKNGYYEKDMLKWVKFEDLDSFKQYARPWYKKFIANLIKYGILNNLINA